MLISQIGGFREAYLPSHSGLKIPLSRFDVHCMQGLSMRTRMKRGFGRIRGHVRSLNVTVALMSSICKYLGPLSAPRVRQQTLLRQGLLL